MVWDLIWIAMRDLAVPLLMKKSPAENIWNTITWQVRCLPMKMRRLHRSGWVIMIIFPRWLPDLLPLLIPLTVLLRQLRIQREISIWSSSILKYFILWKVQKYFITLSAISADAAEPGRWMLLLRTLLRRSRRRLETVRFSWLFPAVLILPWLQAFYPELSVSSLHAFLLITDFWEKTKAMRWKLYSDRKENSILTSSVWMRRKDIIASLQA